MIKRIIRSGIYVKRIVSISFFSLFLFCSIETYDLFYTFEIRNAVFYDNSTLLITASEYEHQHSYFPNKIEAGKSAEILFTYSILSKKFEPLEILSLYSEEYYSYKYDSLLFYKNGKVVFNLRNDIGLVDISNKKMEFISKGRVSGLGENAALFYYTTYYELKIYDIAKAKDIGSIPLNSNIQPFYLDDSSYKLYFVKYKQYDTLVSNNIWDHIHISENVGFWDILSDTIGIVYSLQNDSLFKIEKTMPSNNLVATSYGLISPEDIIANNLQNSQYNTLYQKALRGVNLNPAKTRYVYITKSSVVLGRLIDYREEPIVQNETRKVGEGTVWETIF